MTACQNPDVVLRIFYGYLYSRPANIGKLSTEAGHNPPLPLAHLSRFPIFPLPILPLPLSPLQIQIIWGSDVSSPIGSGQSPAAKRMLVQRTPKPGMALG